MRRKKWAGRKLPAFFMSDIFMLQFEDYLFAGSHPMEAKIRNYRMTGEGEKRRVNKKCHPTEEKNETMG